LVKLSAGPAKYSPRNRQQVYDQMLASAEQLLAGRASAILDGTFLSQKEIARVGRLAERYRARWLVVHCQCPVGVAQERIAARRNRGHTLSEARPELVEEQLTANENNHPSWPVVQCDTTRPAAVLISEVVQRLRQP
jgi:predicted kinase